MSAVYQWIMSKVFLLWQQQVSTLLYNITESMDQMDITDCWKKTFTMKSFTGN
jgi:hypothetical protein